jgi:hypothetical protein
MNIGAYGELGPKTDRPALVADDCRMLEAMRFAYEDPAGGGGGAGDASLLEADLRLNRQPAPIDLCIYGQSPQEVDMRDHDLLLHAIVEIKGIIDRYLEVGTSCPEIAIDRLVEILDRHELVVAIDRRERGFGRPRLIN